MKLSLSKLLLSLSLVLFMSTQLLGQENVQVTVDLINKTASMSNGILSINTNSSGRVTSLNYNGKDLIDASHGGRFYFSYNDADVYSELSPTSLRIEKQSDNYAEIVYARTSGNLLVEQSYIMQKGVSGIHSYVILKGTSSKIKLREMRVVYRVSPLLFNYGYVTDKMQGIMPSVAVMKQVDANSIMDATYPLPDGSIYTKYNWANYIVEDSVHGIMSDNEGIWAISASNEFMNGGPMKQELTVHTTTKTPLVLQMLQGEHFGAKAQEYSTGVEKMYGPFFIYVNSGESHDEMIEDAKQQASLQKSLWPYTWLNNAIYPLERTNVTGKIKVTTDLPSKGIQVVLAEPGEDLYDQGTNYMFWGLTDAEGRFSIPHVRTGDYTLYAYATEGEITSKLTHNDIHIRGSQLDLGTIAWTPPTYANKLWQIGENDRMSKGFNGSDALRAYGLYNNPPANLTYTIGRSTPQKHWYYAQTKEGTWTIAFNREKVYSGNAVLTASIAGSSNKPKVDVYVNNVKMTNWSFSNDAAVYRSAVLGGRHEVKTLTFPASRLVSGTNTIKFKMTDVGNRGGLMYDCIKLEAGSLHTANEYNPTIKSEIAIANAPNPIIDITTFTLSSLVSTKASLSVYNLQGQKIITVFDGDLLPGASQVQWDASNLSSGTYLCRLITIHGMSVVKIQKR